MGCPDGGLDFSRGLFSFFASQSMGELYGSWTFGSGNPPPSSSLPQPTSTPQPKPQPSTTYKASSTTTTSTTHSPTTSSTTSSTPASPPTNTPTPTPTPTDVAGVPSGFIAELYMIMVGLGGLGVEAGSES